MFSSMIFITWRGSGCFWLMAMCQYVAYPPFFGSLMVSAITIIDTHLLVLSYCASCILHLSNLPFISSGEGNCPRCGILI
uniref:Uncharacterized protein n=1 Tax=Arundo donax TaxID=35708 RepID=A0A0A8YPX0_ARUDO